MAWHPRWAYPGVSGARLALGRRPRDLGQRLPEPRPRPPFNTAYSYTPTTSILEPSQVTAGTAQACGCRAVCARALLRFPFVEGIQMLSDRTVITLYLY